MTRCDYNLSDPESSIFGLTKEQLRPIVETLAAGPVTSFTITTRGQVRPHRWQEDEEDQQSKPLIEVSCTTHEGVVAGHPVVVKRLPQPGPDLDTDHACREAYQYAELARHAAPTPVLYGSILDEDDREIIFVEHVDTVAEARPYASFCHNHDLMHQFVGLTAQFDAIHPTSEYAGHVQRFVPVCPEKKNWLEGLQEVWKSAAENALGDEVATFCRDHPLETFDTPVPPDVMFSPSDAICFGHDVWEPGHVGFRRDGSMVAFDFQASGLAPQFSNIARCLGAPDAVEPRCCPRSELAGLYMTEYSKHGGATVSMREFWSRVRAIWLDEAVDLPNRWRLQILAGRGGFAGMLHCMLIALFESRI